MVDVLCRDEAGRLINCEVQVRHEHDDMRRCRFHAASILTNNMPKNTSFANTAVKDGSKKSDLLQLFLETKEPDTTDFPATKGRIHYYKHTNEGRKEMSDAVLDYALKNSVETAITLCKKFNQSKEDAIDAVASANEETPIAKITELVYKNW